MNKFNHLERILSEEAFFLFYVNLSNNLFRVIIITTFYLLLAIMDHRGRKKKKKKTIPQATFLIRLLSLLSICLCRRTIITQDSFFCIYAQSRLALLFSLFLLIYHCRKQAVVTIEYLLSYLTTRERLLHCLSFFYIHR